MSHRKIGMVLFLIGASSLATTYSFAPGILPLHICAASLCYAFFLLCIVFNVCIGLGKRITPRHAVASCDAGLFFAAETIVSGAIWGHRAWGAAWVWEPRLTGMFLMTLFFISWRLSCAIVGRAIVGKGKLTASLIMLGLPSMAFTHLAVRLFGGIHPQTAAQSDAEPLAPVIMLGAAIGHILIGTAIYLFRIRYQSPNTSSQTSSHSSKT